MIFLDDQVIKLGGKILPGLVLSLEVSANTIIEEAKVEGTKKIPRQATGYEDYKVNISLELGDSENKTKEQKLQELENLFRKTNTDKPTPYEIVNKHTQLRKIKKVIFKNLSSFEDTKSDTLVVNLEFVEYERIKLTVTKESNRANKKTVKKKSSKQKAKQSRTSKKKSTTRPKNSAEYQNYLKQRGKSPSIDKSYKGKKITLLQ